MNGLGFLHLELTSRCNKSCWMCGRREIERERPELADWGDMPFELLDDLCWQVPGGIVVQFHNNGEPLLYPNLGPALERFEGNIRCLNTNGKLLVERADEIIGNLETMAVSVIENDPEGGEQYETVRRFLEIKGPRNPAMVYRFLGKLDREETRWARLPGNIARRVLHAPDGSREYRKPPIIPEIGICLDLLNHLAIDRKGRVSLCVRFDPEGDLRLGNLAEMSLGECWASDKRKRYIRWHAAGQREMLPGCNRCEFWGVPRGE